MDINKLEQAIVKMIDDSKGGIFSVGVYSSKEDLLIIGKNIETGEASIVNNMFKVFFEKLQMFGFTNSLTVSALVFENKFFYTSKLTDDFNITTILNPNKIELGYFKGTLLREFYKSI